MSAQPGASSGGGGGNVGSGNTFHKSKYKNAGLDTQEMRRRREEEGIQLRKQKREQQMFKRRNVHTDEIIQVRKQFLKFSVYDSWALFSCNFDSSLELK